MKKTSAFITLSSIALAACLLSACGTTSNLAGTSVSVDVLQKGMAAGLTLAGGSNSVAVGISYAQGTNDIALGVVVPTGAPTTK